MAATYQHYPYLTREEFAEVCHYLDNKYRQARLGQLRSDWRLHLHTAFDESATEYHALVTFVQITKPLEDTADEQQLAAQLSSIGLSKGETRTSKRLANRETRMAEAEAADQAVVVPRHTSRSIFSMRHVVYEIHLHPTYRVPCLWFSLRNLPIEESPLDIETVFRRLVPPEFNQTLRSQGAIGGISIEVRICCVNNQQHHPITGLPTFFVHPCMLGDGLVPFNCTKEDYLMVWLGLMGGCVGLSVPKEMAITAVR